jgi:outer membrane receptor protein involved in Fe transport
LTLSIIRNHKSAISLPPYFSQPWRLDEVGRSGMKNSSCVGVDLLHFFSGGTRKFRTDARIRGPLFRFSLKFLAAVVLLAMASALMAQVGTGSITGTVTDSTGAVVVGASVTVTDVQTGVVHHIASHADGRYVAPDLNVSVYNVEAQATGFQAQKHVGIQLLVGRQLVVDFALAVGAQKESVEVQGGASEVETTTSEVSAQIGQQQLRELPLNGRDFEQLLNLVPGVQQISNVMGGAYFGRESSYSVAGSRPEGQAFLLDGTEIQNFWNRGAGNGITGTSLGVDAIGEFQVLTNTYSARFGGSGSVVNQTTRSGTNQLHGSGFEFIRNSVLDAKNYFDSASAPIPEFRRNQFGGTLGGPIKKDKLFFFVNYEGLRQLMAETMGVVVPDAQARQGYVNGVNYNPLNPAIAATLALWPALSPAAVDLGNGVADDVRVGFQPANEDYVNTRWDYTLGAKDSLFARYVIDNGSLTEPFSELPYGLPLGLYPENGHQRNQYVTLSERHMGNTFANDVRYSFVRTNANASTTLSNPPLQFYPGEGRQDGIVTIGGFSGGFSQLGPDAVAPLYQIVNTHSVGDDLTWTKGKHTLSFGVDLARQQANTFSNVMTAGIWTFTSVQGLLQDQPSSFAGALPNEANSYRSYWETHVFPYFQDDWRVLPTLTLNLGLRWDFVSNPTEQHDLMCAYANPASPTQADCTFVPHAFASNPSLKSLDPRVGFAWDPFKNHKTSIRGGIGLFHDPIPARFYSNSYGSAKPYETSVEVCAPIFPPCVYPTPYAGGFIPIAVLLQGLPYNIDTTPFVMQYNLGIQREILPGTVLNVAYIGSHGYNLFVGNDLNPPIPTTTNGVINFAGVTPGTETISENAPRANPNLGSAGYDVPDGTSWYNSLQIYLTRNLGKTVAVQANYTYSRCEDTGSVAQGADGMSSGMVQEDPYNLMLDKGLCNFDVGQAFTGNVVYSLPFTQNALVKGWQWSLIANAHSGNPFTVFDGFDRADLNSSQSERPNLVPGRSNNPKVGSVSEWYDPSAFSLQAPGTLGDLGRNTLIGPGFADFDMALAKMTKLTERVGMQFRFEVFNFVNHPNFALPDQGLYMGPAASAGGPVCAFNINCLGPGLANPDAGKIHSTISSSRQLQFGLKFTF